VLMPRTSSTTSARAFPPPGRRLIVDENQQGLTPYFFS